MIPTILPPLAILIFLLLVWVVKCLNILREYERAAVLSREPMAITLRYLQTLIEIGVEKNTTIVFPLPLDLLAGLGITLPPGLAGPSASKIGGPP